MAKITCVIIGIIATVVFSLFCFVMSIVFSYVPSLVYPQKIVNVEQSGNATEFYLRCDVASGEDRSSLLKDCGVSGYIV